MWPLASVNFCDSDAPSSCSAHGPVVTRPRRMRFYWPGIREARGAEFGGGVRGSPRNLEVRTAGKVIAASMIQASPLSKLVKQLGSMIEDIQNMIPC